MKLSFFPLKRGLAVFFQLWVVFVFVNNTRFRKPDMAAPPVLLAHRGMAQPFHREGLTGATCTAARMIPVEHNHLENTLPSMAAAFEAGAQIVEIDVHLTPDGKFAIFHDWELDCRTDGSGVTRNQPYDSLKLLDVGYGYTPDSGKTYPFRGKGVGMMPHLEEVLATFPDQEFLIDVKSKDPQEGERLSQIITECNATRTGAIRVYGGTVPVNRVRQEHPGMQTTTRPRLKKCLVQYFFLGWSGYVPGSCEDCMVMVPSNFAPWLWGWPHVFVDRMERSNALVLLQGSYGGQGFSTGFDDPEQVPELPRGYTGGIWTDRIDLIAPAVHQAGN